MKILNLYQEIIILQHFYNGKWCIENVKSYYDPLIQPQVSGRHYFWSNLQIPVMKSRVSPSKIWGKTASGKDRQNEFSKLGFDLSNYDYPKKEKLLRNCVDPLIGKAILDKVLEIEEYNSIKQGTLF